MPSALLFDTNGVYEYVFATPYLRDIRGGSALLHLLNRELMAKVIREIDPESECVFADGGMALFVLGSSRVELARQAVRREYLTRTHRVSVSSACMELPDNYKTAGISQELRLLHRRLRAVEGEQPCSVSLPASPFFRPCEACGVDYAVGRREGDPRNERLCAACLARRDAAYDAHDLFPKLSKALRSQDGRRRPLPPDFEQLSDLSRPSGYFGLVCVDGNGMTRALEERSRLTEATRLVDCVQSALDTAVTDSGVENLAPQPEDEWTAYEGLLKAGDDRVFITRAQSALGFALGVVEGFPKAIRALGAPPEWGPLGVSASVVLSHSSFPFGLLLNLGLTSLKAAKQAGLREGKPGTPPESMINFLVVTSPNHLDFGRYYDENLRVKQDGSPEQVRTIRPCSPSQMRHLMQAVSDMRRGRLPSSRIQQLREACYLNALCSRLEGLTLLARSRSNQRKTIENAFFDVMGPDSSLECFPWLLEPAQSDRGERLTTPFVDIAEIMPFLPGDGEVGPDS